MISNDKLRKGFVVCLVASIYTGCVVEACRLSVSGFARLSESESVLNQINITNTRLENVMNKTHPVEILVDDKIMRLFAEPQHVFSVVNGLILQGMNPQIRTFDTELDDWTCWQPLPTQNKETK